MKHSYHTHTFLCHHATGTPREYVEEGIKNGLEVLGFSDHVPYPFHNGHTSFFRMETDKTELYYKTVAALREEYKDDIKILIGYEAEYYKDEFSAMLDNIGKYGCDYLLLGQHFTKNEYDGFYSGDPTEDKNKLTEYIKEVTEAMEKNIYTYLAHPDLINFIGDKDYFQKSVKELCYCAKETETPIEINLLGLREGRFYPNDAFWEVVSDVGPTVVMGCDSHSPEVVADEASVKLGLAYAKRFGLEITDDIPIKKVF